MRKKVCDCPVISEIGHISDPATSGEAPQQRSTMSGGQERDDQPPILDGLDGSIARTDPEFPTDIALDHELETFTHGRHDLSMTKASFVCQR